MHYIYIFNLFIIFIEVAGMLISLVGLSGSGKSYISELLCSYNQRIVRLDIDKIGHQALLNEEVKANLVSSLGIEILNNETGNIDRKKLSQIVFTSPMAMQVLTDLTWSYMEKQIDMFIDENQDKIIILDWLLLPKTKYFLMSDLRILVTAPQEVRMQRAMARDNISAEKFLIRDANAPELDKIYFDYVINNVEMSKTKKEVAKIYDKSIIYR